MGSLYTSSQAIELILQPAGVRTNWVVLRPEPSNHSPSREPDLRYSLNRCAIDPKISVRSATSHSENSVSVPSVRIFSRGSTNRVEVVDHGLVPDVADDHSLWNEHLTDNVDVRPAAAGVGERAEERAHQSVELGLDVGHGYSSHGWPFFGEDRPDLAVVPHAPVRRALPQHTIAGHPEPARGFDAAGVASRGPPFDPAHPAFLESPVDQRPACPGHQPSAFPGRLQPAADLAHPGGGVELREHDAADQRAVQPDPIDPGGVLGLVVGVALEDGRGGVEVGAERRPGYPRVHVGAGAVDMGEELLGVPGLQGAELSVVTDRQCEHGYLNPGYVTSVRHVR